MANRAEHLDEAIVGDARVQRLAPPTRTGRGPGVFPAGDQPRRGGQGLGQPVPGRAQRHLQLPVPDCGLDRTSWDQRAKSGSHTAPGRSVAAPRRAPVRNSKATRTIPLAQTSEKRIVIRSVIIGPLDPGNDRIPTGAVRTAHPTVIPHLIAYPMLYYFRLTCKSASNFARLSGRG